MAFRYDTLPDNGFFRIFMLEPGDTGDSLRGSLETYSRDKAPPYEALSYVWGSPYRLRSMECDGRIFLITESLNEALRHIRSAYSPRRIWIDQICINQSNRDERRQQVTIMREIFANAKMVNAWLGMEGAEQAKSVARVISIMASNNHMVIIQGNRAFPRDDYLQQRHLPIRSSPVWAALNDMLNLPYFERVWIIQEIAVSSQFQLLWGDVTISGPTFRAAREWAMMQSMHLAEPDPSGPSPSLALERTCVTFDPPDMRPTDWLGLVTLTMGHQATDGRDRIFALMGLVDEPDYNIIADYTKEEVDVFRDFTIQVISHSKSLAILSHCRVKRLEAAEHPLWVPRWTRSEDELPSTLDRHDFNASKGFDASLDKGNTSPAVLVLSGLQVDVVMDVGASMTTEGAFAITNSLRLIEKHRQVFAERYGSNPMKPLLLSMIAGRGRDIFGGAAGSLYKDDHLDSFLAYSQRAFIEFLQGGHIHDAKLLLGLMSSAFEASASATQGEPIYQSEDTFRWFTDVFTQLFEGSEESITSCLKMFKTIGKGIGKGREFGECFLDAALYRRFFITKKGFIGVGPPSMEIGDNVAVLFGGPTPYIRIKAHQSDAIPHTQRAAVRVGYGAAARVSVKTIPVAQPAPHQILVKINWSGLCASDKSLLRDEWAGYNGMIPPMATSTLGIAGHEGAGVVVAVGDQVSTLWKVGDRAGVKWIESTCGTCEMCSNGFDEAHCPRVVHHAVEVAGTFQQYCVTDGRYATKIPDGVTDEDAGPIMCGGFSAYAACKRTAVKPGEWLVVLGAGGGVGHFALQYAKAMGMRVIAVDKGEEKEKVCRLLGADEFVDFSNDLLAEVMRITTHGAHGVLVAAPPQEAYDLAPYILRASGTMVALAIPKFPSVMAGSSAALISGKRLNIVGSLVGTKREADEALEFAARGLVRPVLTKGTLDDVDKFCDLLEAGKVPGRVILKVST